MESQDMKQMKQKPINETKTDKKPTKRQQKDNKKSNAPRWTAPEVEILFKAHLEQKTVAEVQALLPNHRSLTNIQAKAARMRTPLCKKKETYQTGRVRKVTDHSMRRPCHCCGELFVSTGKYNILCLVCKNLA